MQRISSRIGDATFTADATGEGPCVVLLHAGVADRRMWRENIVALSPHYRCIAYDRRGFGLTATSDVPFRHADDLEDLLDQWGCQNTHLIGSSQGSRIAIDFALAHPGKVKSLTLVAPALTGSPAPGDYPVAIARLMADLDEAEAAADFDRVNAIEARLWLDGPLSPEGRVGGPLRDLFLDMNAIALRHAPLTGEQSCESAIGRLSRISLPVLVICGSADFPHVQERSRLISQSIPGARQFVMHGPAHFPNLELPAQFNAAVREFLAGP